MRARDAGSVALLVIVVVAGAGLLQQFLELANEFRDKHCDSQGRTP